MRYMFLIYSDPALEPDYSTPEGQAEMAGWYTLTQSMQDAGVFLAGDPLQPPTAATTVRVRDGRALTTDGPFAETKEALGGYYLLDLPDLDAALGWASKFPNVGYGSIEVRPVMEM